VLHDESWTRYCAGVDVAVLEVEGDTATLQLSRRAGWTCCSRWLLCQASTVLRR
jgi:hypothetical protein